MTWVQAPGHHLGAACKKEASSRTFFNPATEYSDAGLTYNRGFKTTCLVAGVGSKLGADLCWGCLSCLVVLWRVLHGKVPKPLAG